MGVLHPTLTRHAEEAQSAVSKHAEPFCNPGAVLRDALLGSAPQHDEGWGFGRACWNPPRLVMLTTGGGHGWRVRLGNDKALPSCFRLSPACIAGGDQPRHGDSVRDRDGERQPDIAVRQLEIGIDRGRDVAVGFACRLGAGSRVVPSRFGHVRLP